MRWDFRKRRNTGEEVELPSLLNCKAGNSTEAEIIFCLCCLVWTPVSTRHARRRGVGNVWGLGSDQVASAGEASPQPARALAGLQRRSPCWTALGAVEPPTDMRSGAAWCGPAGQERQRKAPYVATCSPTPTPPCQGCGWKDVRACVCEWTREEGAGLAYA